MASQCNAAIPEPSLTDARELFDIPAAAAFIRQMGGAGVSEWTIRRLIASKQLRHLKLGRRIFVSREALAEMLQRLERRSK